MFTVRDFIEEKETIYGWKETLAQGRIMALSSRTGRVVFDTHKNTKDYIKNYYNKEVRQIWADAAIDKNGVYGSGVRLCLKMYIYD